MLIISMSSPTNISTLFQYRLLVDTALRSGVTANQRWKNLLYFIVEIYNVVYFNLDMNNVRQRRTNVVLFNVEFNNFAKWKNNLLKITISKKKKKLFQKEYRKSKVLTTISESSSLYFPC